MGAPAGAGAGPTSLLPRLIPGNPVDTIVASLARGGGLEGDQLHDIHEHYVHAFGLDKPLWEQFAIYIMHLVARDLGFSVALDLAPLRQLILQALPVSLA